MKQADEDEPLPSAAVCCEHSSVNRSEVGQIDQFVRTNAQAVLIEGAVVPSQYGSRG
jgi:hypothetical protein